MTTLKDSSIEKAQGISLRSPAKINLFLRILGKRPDGYHELASLMQAIDLCDTIHFSLSTTDQFSCSEASLPMDASNLVCKAVALFRQKTALTHPLQIHLHKKIPREAGLGGGSSNAATTLYALNQLLNASVSHEELIKWAGELGSDVAFFLSHGTAYCTGRGECIRPIAPLPAQSFWIVKPTFGLSTPAVYRALLLDSLEQRQPLYALDAFMKGEGVPFNDLEEAAWYCSPQLLRWRELLLLQGFKRVLLCGSGSSLACFGSPRKVPKLPEPGELFPVRFLQRHAYSWF